nr:N-6 DNA methylase [Sedimentibacter sp.]
MNKAFVKKVVSIIGDINNLNSTNYISYVKYVIFFISKILYICKTSGDEILNKNLSHVVLNDDCAGIFEEYSIFDLGQAEVEQKVYKLLNDFKTTVFHDNFVPAELYELLLTSKEKKTLGQVYTPSKIVEKMLSETFDIQQIHAEMKILDPACGGGYFLINALKKIREKSVSDSLNIDDKYILENMIYGIDIDNFSIFLTKMGLIFNSSCDCVNFNIMNVDFLTKSDDLGVFFDIIIGNPPYIGHKQTTQEYRTILKDRYSNVFYDKSDISYCFFKKGKELLKVDGVLCLITSRYFMEAMYADKLRNFIKESFNIVSIVDYNGFRVFKEAMVSPAIITLSNKNLNKNTFLYVKYNIDDSKIDNFTYGQTKLNNNGWIILNSKEEQLFNRIEAISNTYIKDVCNIKQGIITGLDKAFIVDEEKIQKYKIEKFLLKKWIKNSNISKTNISYKNMYLIYTNMIDKKDDCPNTIKYLESYKETLMNRRECKNHVRKWYELQWGRVQSDFENPKILFPYKSDSNNFCLDKNEYFCSADIYFINELKYDISFEYLQNYLNSNLFEFYFKCQAKKVGANLFEYYPNKLNFMKIYLPDKNLVKNIFNLGKISIDNFLEKVFNISGEERAIINKYITKKGDDAK